MNEAKRVYCLYRVSTTGQVEKDDIPMQRQVCHEFCKCKPGWSIEKEFYEKGISGFKLSAKDRDAIQEIQIDAALGKFDVLLVFMFDRLDRRDDETPFVVEWFVHNGIEVWSAVEGQQRFDNHVDKLLNYIRYWQASGESIKTSIRVKTRMEQLTESGYFTGGSVPLGYRLEKRGRTNKRNQEVKDIVVDEEEAKTVQLIFYKYVHEGYGTQRLCRYLSEMGVVGKNGRNLPNTSINRIIKNPIYTGIIHNGEANSDIIPELQIIDKETFDRAQELMRERVTHHNSTPLNSSGKALLVGRIFCGHCGNRLTLTTSGRKRKKADGTLLHETRYRYQCHYNLRHPGECDGQSGYGVMTMDALAEKIVKHQFAKIQTMSGNDVISAQHQREVELAQARYKQANLRLNEKRKELEDYRAETLSVIRGQSRLSIDLLNSLVEESKTAVEELTATVEKAKAELDACLSSASVVNEEYNKLTTWADLYDNCTFEARKMIISQFIKAIHVYRGYRVEVEFNVSFEDFQHLTADAEIKSNKEVLLEFSA